MLFDGFLKLYEEGRDDTKDEDARRLPQVSQGDKMQLAQGGVADDFAKSLGDDGLPDQDGDLIAAANAIASADQSVLGQQHFTQPPPRYTEATLVKRMEELGIGRPSTYASIIDTVQNRGYVRKDKNRLFPEDKGRLVTVFLSNYFRKYVEYDFTADLENQLDEVSAGDRAYKDVLALFWHDFSAAIAETLELRITDVLDKINEVLEPHLFPVTAEGGDPRLCPNCGEGRLSMRTARSGGAFIGCSNYPNCRYTRPFGPPDAEGAASGIGPDGKMLGVDPDTSQAVTLRDGRFGPYVQLGEATQDIPKPPRASLPKTWTPDSIDLDRALQLLALPRKVGDHPEDGETVEAGLGRYGPFVKHGRLYANLPDIDEVFTIGMNRAVELLAQKAAGRGARGTATKPLKDLGEHPQKGGPIHVMSGRYGPYVKWQKINATLPKDVEPESIGLEAAIALIAEKEAKGGKGTGRKKATTKTASKAAAKKAPAKKTTAKKTTPKKATSKKAQD